MADRTRRRARPTPDEPLDPTIRPDIGQSSVLGDRSVSQQVTEAQPEERVRRVSKREKAEEEARSRLREQQPIGAGAVFSGVHTGADLPRITPSSGTFTSITPPRPNKELAGLYASILIDERMMPPDMAARVAEAWAVIYGPTWETNADLQELAYKSGIAAIGAIELDDFFTTVTNYGPGDLAAQLNNATADQLSELELLFRTEERRLVSADAHQTMIVQWTDTALQSAGLDIEALGLQADTEKQRAGVALSEVQATTDDEDAVRAFHLVNRSTGLPMNWQITSNSLVMSLETESAGEFIYHVRLEEEIDGDSPLAVFVAVTQAQWGTKHELVRADEIPGRQMFLGNINEFVGTMSEPAFRWFDENNELLLQAVNTVIPFGDRTPEGSTADRHRAGEESRILAAAHNAQIDSDNLAILAAGSFAGDGGINLGHVNLGAETFADVSPEDKDIIAGQFSPTPEQVETALDENGLLDTRHGAKRTLDTTAEAFATVAGYWERVAQMNIVSVLDFFIDIGEGTLEGLGFMEPGNTHEDGRNLFFSAFDWEAGSAAFRGETTIADYLHVPDQLRGGINLIGTIAGDPFTWGLLGGAARAAHVTTLMKTPAGTMEWLNTQGRAYITRFERYLGRGRPDALPLAAVALESGLPPSAIFNIRNGMPIKEAMHKAMVDDLYVPALGGGVKLRTTAESVGRLAGLGGKEPAIFLRKYLSQWSNQGRVRLTSGNFWEDMLGEMIAGSTHKGYGSAQFADDFARLLEMTDNAGWAKTVNRVEVEQLFAQRRALATEAKTLGHRETFRLDKLIPLDEDAALRAAAAGAKKPASKLPAGFEATSEEWLTRKASAEGWTTKWRDNKALLDSARSQNAALAVNRQRAAYGAFHKEWWDAHAERLGIPLTAQGKPKWSVITQTESRGSKWWDRTFAKNNRGETPKLGMNEQIEALTGVDGVPILTRATSLESPVSSMMAVAWSNRHSDSWWSNTVAKAMQPSFRKTIISRVLQAQRKLLSINVLTNPFSFLRSNLSDEPLRHGLQRGWKGRKSRVEGVDDVFGAIEAGTRRVLAGPRILGLGQLDDAINRVRPMPAQAVAHQQQLAAPVTTFVDDQGAQFVARSAKAAKEMGEFDLVSEVGKGATARAANSLFAGVLADQPLLSAYAASRLADDGFAGLLRYWDDEGGRIAAGTVKDLSGGSSPLLPAQVIKGYDDMIAAFVHQAPDAARPAVEKAILEAIATGEPLSPYVARQFKMLPAFESADNSAFGRIFNALFGRPGAVHGGLVWQDFYEQTRFILQERHANRILTAERFKAQYDNMSLAMAKHHLWRMSDEAVDMASRKGLFLPRQIHSAASRVATQHAEHMAYKMGAQSLAGQKAGKGFIFLKAQTDFAGYYLRELMSGSMLGLHPKFRSILEKAGVNVADPRFLTHMPFNIRLAARMMDLFGTITTFDEDVADAQRNDRDPFQVLLDRYTFIPAEFNDNMWLQIEPGFDPTPAWLLHMIPANTDDEDHPLVQFAGGLRDFLDASMPSFAFFEDTASWNPLDFEFGPAAFSLADSTASARRAVETGVIRPAAALADHMFSTGLQEAWSNIAGAPPGFHVDLRITGANAVADNPNMFADALRNDSGYDDLVDQVIRDSFTRATGDAVHDYGNAILEKSGWNIDRDDGEFLELNRGFIRGGAIANLGATVAGGDPTAGTLAWLRAGGLVDDRQFDEINELWLKFEENTITRTEATRLSDEIHEIIFGVGDLVQGYLIMHHPELVGNAVSQWKVTEDAPDKFRNGEGLVVRAGQDGRDLRELGQQERWLVRREPEELILSMFQKFGDAARTVRNELWSQAFDLKSFGQPNADDDRSVTISEFNPDGSLSSKFQLADAMGMEPGKYSINELYARLINDWGPSFGNAQPFNGSIAERRLQGTFAADALKELRDDVEDKGFEPQKPREWDEEDREAGRLIYRQAIKNPFVDFNVAQYNRYLAPFWGELDFSQKAPPELTEVPIGETDDTYRLPVDPKDLVVVDGDTVAIEYDPAGRLGANMAQVVEDTPHFTQTSSGAQRIRLIGVNAMEQNSVLIEGGDSSYADQTLALRRLLAAAETVDFVVFDAEEFGTLQTVEDGVVRWLMVMYIDGKPLWAPTVFTSVNVTGKGLGGEGVLNVPWVKEFLEGVS